jgi:hypothetical protein
VKLKNYDIPVEMLADELADRILATDVFAAASQDQVRRPLVVITDQLGRDPEAPDPNPVWLAALKKLSGPWQSWSYSGRATIHPHEGVTVMLRGESFAVDFHPDGKRGVADNGRFREIGADPNDDGSGPDGATSRGA